MNNKTRKLFLGFFFFCIGYTNQEFVKFNYFSEINSFDDFISSVVYIFTYFLIFLGGKIMLNTVKF